MLTSWETNLVWTKSDYCFVQNKCAQTERSPIKLVIGCVWSYLYTNRDCQTVSLLSVDKTKLLLTALFECYDLAHCYLLVHLPCGLL